MRIHCCQGCHAIAPDVCLETEASRMLQSQNIHRWTDRGVTHRSRRGPMRHRGIAITWGLFAVPTSTDETYTTSESAFTSVPSATAQPRAKDWFDLDVGDCLVALPQVDLGEVSVDLVDCTRPHAGEVFLRAPVEVNAAVADVAD